MAKFHVTVRASLPKGLLYWVTDVEARSEERAIRKAVETFEKEMEENDDWSFTDYEVTRL